jgi:predicted acyl esterase
MRIIIAVVLMITVGLLGEPIVSAQTTPQAAHESAAATAPPAPLFDYQEVMIPMRDGARLQTVIMRSHAARE